MANPNNMPPYFGSFENDFIGDEDIVDDLRSLVPPRRATLALNLALLRVASHAMYKRDSNFEDAMLGRDEIQNPRPSFDEVVRDCAWDMQPFLDDNFFQFLLDDLYPSPACLRFLGPVMVRKVFLCAPLFDLVAPEEVPYAIRLPAVLHLEDESLINGEDSDDEKENQDIQW